MRRFSAGSATTKGIAASRPPRRPTPLAETHTVGDVARTLAKPPHRRAPNRGRRPPLRTIRAGVLRLLLLALGAAACGDDVGVSVRFSSGTVTETAQCTGGGGQFPLLQENGLSVVVILTENTTIVRADFSPAACSDVVKGERASVQGTSDGGRIRADEVELLDS